MATNKDLINYNIAPYLAQKIGVYNSEGVKVGTVPLGNLKKSFGSRLYRFGVLSDVHQQSSQTTENQEDFRNALTVLNNKESVVMTCICGDVTQNGGSEFTRYKDVVDSHSPNTPVYTTIGNHDCKSFSVTTWRQNCNLNVPNENFSSTQLSFEITKNNDHFLFLGMKSWSLGSSGKPYDDADIEWLKNKLHSYKNERCFIFTHLFFYDRAGNFNRSADMSALYPNGNWLLGAQYTALSQMCDVYKNTIWFSGHSHWKWYLQKYKNKSNFNAMQKASAENDNVWKGNGGWCVHIPSCASPIDSVNGENRAESTDYTYKSSEGAIVDVYDNYVDIRGVSFKANDADGTNVDETYNTRYLPISTFRLDTTLQEVDDLDYYGPDVEPEPVIDNTITLTASEIANYNDITANILGATNTLFNGTGNGNKVGFYVNVNGNSVYSLKNEVYNGQPVELSSADTVLAHYKESYSGEAKNIYNFIGFSTSSSFSISPAITSKHIKVILKNVYIEANGVKRLIDASNVFVRTGDKSVNTEAIFNAVQDRGNHEFSITLDAVNEKFLFITPEMPSSALSSVVSKVTIGNAKVIQLK